MVVVTGSKIITGRRLGALFIAIGISLGFYSLFVSSLLYDDFLPRCSPDVGCNALLAASTIAQVRDLGYQLSLGAFLFGLGLGLMALPSSEAEEKG